MIGVFDSGAGGLNALSEIRRLNPTADICFYADYKNAPYGTKSKNELIRLVYEDILKLKGAGADKILMACCTASTIYKYLPKDMQNISLPIIDITSKEASLATKNGRVGVIGTEATISSKEFTKSLSNHKEVTAVFELATQNLVAAVESGICDGNFSNRERNMLFKMLLPIRQSGIDTLILGCTHFSRLEKEIGGCLPGVSIISSSREGAKEILKNYALRGRGKTVYL